jgi:hypothetical protein
VNRLGGSAAFEDVPLPPWFKFAETDVQSGALAQKIQSIAGDPSFYFQAQNYYRHYLYLEKDMMTLQLRRLLQV